jgi:hypothetical protein
MQTTARRPWRAPTFVEIPMNAEVGSYQNEFDDRTRQQPPKAKARP